MSERSAENDAGDDWFCLVCGGAHATHDGDCCCHIPLRSGNAQ